MSLLVRLSEQAGVLRIEKVYPSIPLQNNGSSQEDASARAHGATAWHGAGIEGEGIRVGVIDGGFQDFSTMVDTATVTVMARCHRGEDEDPSSNISDCANNTDHGTVVTEALLGIAPNVSLYIADARMPMQRQGAVAWMIGEGVQVINFSAGTPWDGPGDGTSPDPYSPLNSVNDAVNAGIIWVNAAGNLAKRTWFSNSGFTDDDMDGILEFNDTGAEGNEVDLSSGQEYTFQLRWQDTWPETASDPGAERNLNLYLYHKPVEYEGGMSMVAQSVRPQTRENEHTPLEVIDFNANFTGRYCLTVRLEAGVSPGWIQLQEHTGRTDSLRYNTGSGSINNPAESNNPGLLAVGAADLSDPPEIESYSSRGPTPEDNRTKPDLVGAVDQLPGTSYAAPRVAGLAALVIQHMGDDPSYDSPDKIATYLKNNTLDRDGDGVADDPDNTWGHGFAQLPELLAVPTMLTAVGSEGEIRVRWTDEALTNPAVTGYRLEFQQARVGTEDSEEWSDYALLTTITNGSTTTYTHTTDATDYRYRVRARPAGQWSADFPGNGVIPAGVPDPPHNLRATVGNGQVTLSWKTPADNGSAITGYEYRHSSDGARTWAPDWGTIRDSDAETTSHRLERLTNGTAYTFEVRTVNAVGAGDSARVAATPGRAPDPVRNLRRAAAGNGQVTLSWGAPLSDGGLALTGYEYRQSADSGRTWPPDWTAVAPPLATSLTRTGLESCTFSTFEVRARNEAGPGDSLRVLALPYWSGSLAADTTWSGRVCVDGDVTIPAGVTLTLDAETEVAFHPGGDATEGGADQTRSELIVAGTLSAGTGVTFRSLNAFTPSTSDWSGIRVDSGGSADLSGATVRDGARCVQAHTSGTVTMTNTTLSPCGQSVSLSSRRSQAQVGVGLTATLEGETEAVSEAHWQWQGRNDRDSAPAWADLAGASQLVSYTPVAADIGHRLRATVRYGPGSGSYSNYAQSAATRVVQGPPPTGFAVWPDHEAVLLLWDASDDAPITHWRYGVKEGAKYAWTEVANSEVPATEYGGRMIRYHRIGSLFLV